MEWRDRYLIFYRLLGVGLEKHGFVTKAANPRPFVQNFPLGQLGVLHSPRLFRKDDILAVGVFSQTRFYRLERMLFDVGFLQPRKRAYTHWMLGGNIGNLANNKYKEFYIGPEDSSFSIELVAMEAVAMYERGGLGRHQKYQTLADVYAATKDRMGNFFVSLVQLWLVRIYLSSILQPEQVESDCDAAIAAFSDGKRAFERAYLISCLEKLKAKIKAESNAETLSK